MADGEVPSKSFGNMIQSSSASDESELSSGHDSDNDENTQLNLLKEFTKNHQKPRIHSEDQGASGSGLNDLPKKEENPFSFKHFLKSDKKYQNQGARPKVYCEGRPISSVSDLDLRQTTETKQTRIVPEFSSALPDFVQDHLVIEQCYLGKDMHDNYVKVNNLPDFAPSRDSINVNRLNVESSRNLDRRSECNSNENAIPLDLPMRPQAGFPLDLPIASSHSAGQRSGPPTAEVGVSKSLPDFLADGAAHSQATDGISAGQSPEWETDRLREELDLCRRHLSEQTRRADCLQHELDATRSKEHEYTQNLARTLKQVEENLERSKRRAASAEGDVLKLKQEIKSLTSQINQLQIENNSLRYNEGATGGPSFVPPNELHSQRLAQELRNAASTAEHSLRQLLTGVDNLRIMAATLENMHRIEERTESFLDLDDEAGPAL